jgi:N-acetylneuraminic acid mutarotase
MRRYALSLFLFLFLLVVLFQAVVWAQEAGPTAEPVTVAPPAQLVPLHGVWQPIELEPVERSQFPLLPHVPLTVNQAADSCEAAFTLENIPGGDESAVNTMSESVDDPDLSSCMWGNPPRDTGYRTVWYQFEAPRNGQVVIDTSGSNYDTVLAAFGGACDSLTQLACNDDRQGFTSRVSFAVSKGATYYVEVADWQQNPPSGSANLRIAALLEPIDSQWKQIGSMPRPRSRHATVAVGDYIYVIGGQTKEVGDPPQITRELDRYHTVTGAWDDSPADKPGAGYANTTAAYANGRIYLPSGDTGNNTSYDGTHWVYDIGANVWFTQTSAPWPNGTPFAWSTAVVPPTQNGYYLAGGLSSLPPFTTTAQVRNELFFYSSTSNSWSPRTKLNAARYAHTGAWVGGRVCVTGGISTGFVLLINGECYDPGTGSWTPTGNMNYPRFNAGSAVGPNGRWYVFGGITVDDEGNQVPATVTEVYDPATNNWSALGVRYDLGGSESVPARIWPRGEAIGNHLWAVGGNTPDNLVLPLVERLFIPTHELFLPFAAKAGPGAPDDTFGQARPLPLNWPQQHNFDNSNDYFDVFYFDLASRTDVTVRLTQIPSGSDYDVAIYSANKLLWGKGDNTGSQSEVVPLALGSGRYYVMVERVFPFGLPDTSNYRIVVEG